MKHRIIGLSVLLLIALLLMGSTGPQRVSAQAEFAPINSTRMDVLYTFDNMPVRVCQEEIADFNHWHGTCIDVTTVTLPNGLSYTAGRTLEFIYFECNYFTRLNGDEFWSVQPNPHYFPKTRFSDALLGTPALTGKHTATVIGPADVAGQATTQIQFWSTDAEVYNAHGGQAVTDLFVNEDGLIVKAVNSVRSEAGDFVQLVVLHDINEPIEVYSPRPELVCPSE